VASPLELRGVGKLLGTAWAVRGVTVAIAAGELFSVVGPPGSGKTTLLRMVAGFADPDLGEIRVDGESIADVPPERRDLGFVPTRLGLWPHQSVFEHIAFGLRERRMAVRDVRTRVAETLRLVGLEGVERRHPAQLDETQRCRLALGRVLASKPRALVLDDPLAPLDARRRASMGRELRRIHRETAITTLHATGDVHDATALATRTGILDRGEVVQIGPPAEVYRRPLTRAAAELLGDATVLAGRLESGPGGQIVRVKDVLTLTVSATGLPPGAAVICLIRPEVIHRAAADARGPNRLFATLASAAWVRGRWECELALAAGVTLRAELPATGPTAPAVGDLVTVLLAADDIIVLPG